MTFSTRHFLSVIIAGSVYVPPCVFYYQTEWWHIQETNRHNDKIPPTLSVSEGFYQGFMGFLPYPAALYQKCNLYHKEHKQERCNIRLSACSVEKYNDSL